MNGTREIPLTRGMVAIVDAEDYERMAAFKWHTYSAHGKFYATRNQSRKISHKTLWMHRELLNAAPGTEVDHIDGDGLNNRRSNLRFVTHQQNLCNTKTRKDNTSGHKGVSLFRGRQWQAKITAHGHQKHIGFFDRKEDAIAAYLEAAKEHHGEFARTERTI